MSYPEGYTPTTEDLVRDRAVEICVLWGTTAHKADRATWSAACDQARTEMFTEEALRGKTIEAPTCEWFALCDNPAIGTVEHPVLGAVPTCGRCADKLDLEVVL